MKALAQWMVAEGDRSPEGVCTRLRTAPTSLMTLPYAQQYDYVVLWMLAGDGIGLLSHFHGLLSSAFGREGARDFQIVTPLATYAILVAGPIQSFLKARRPFDSGGPVEPPA